MVYGINTGISNISKVLSYNFTREKVGNVAFYTRLFLVFSIVCATLFDIITFLMMHSKNITNGYESNPIFVYTNSVWFVLLFKIAVIFVVIFMVCFIHPDQKGTKGLTAKYILFFTFIMTILLQCVGGYSNMQLLDVHTDYVNGDIAEMPPTATATQSVNAYLSVIGFLLIYPLALGALAFWFMNTVFLSQLIKK